MPQSNNTEYVRGRYARDPEFRKMRAEANRRHYERVMSDPVAAELFREKKRVYKRKQRANARARPQCEGDDPRGEDGHNL